MEKVMGKYETVFIVNTELGEEKVQELVAKFKGMIEKNATVDNIDEWGKKRLAYPIEDVNDGYYVVIQYTADHDFPAELERVFNITEGILRSMTIRLDA
jgi:small subunit ribosomal protein S6